MNPKEKLSATHQEIERKFRVRDIPEGFNLDQYPHQDIRQGYLAVTEAGTEVRIRQKGKKYTETVKSGSGVTRLETEIVITEEQFNALWEATAGARVEKTRYDIPDGNGIIELDVYHNESHTMTAEREFVSLEESNNYEPPVWFAEDITGKPGWSNSEIARHGFPPDDNPAQMVFWRMV